MQTMIERYIDTYSLANPNAKRQYILVRMSYREQGAFASNVALTIRAMEGDKKHWEANALYDELSNLWFCLTPSKGLLLFKGNEPKKSGYFTKLTSVILGKTQP